MRYYYTCRILYVSSLKPSYEGVESYGAEM